MKEIAVFGGTFDPPTRAHEAIMAGCLEQDAIDEVWLMPSGMRPDKPDMTANMARLAMLELVKADSFGNDERLVVTDFEQRLRQPTRTYQTVRALQETYEDHHFWFVFGADAYHDMPHWENGDHLRQAIGMLLVERKGHDLPPEGGNIRHLSVALAGEGISSSAFREAHRATAATQDLVNEAVLKYIHQEALYEKGENPNARV